MNLEFLLPGERLTSVFANYYRVSSDDAQFVETDRADVGHLRFLVKGHGHVEFLEGARFASGDAMLIGPGTAAAEIRLEGPVEVYGISLLPTAWGGGFIDAAASDHADRISDPAPLLGRAIEGLCDEIAAAPDFASVAGLLDAAFSPLVAQLRPGQETAIAAIRDWLTGSANPQVSDLLKRLPLSAKQAGRYAKMHFGAPPKMLARKFRALFAAQAIYLNDGEVDPAFVEPFYDQSHMSREIKRFTGRSPGRLASPEDLMLQTLIARPYFYHETDPDMPAAPASEG